MDPKSALSGTTPVIKSSTHYFFKLSDPRAVEFLREWTTGNGADGKPRVQAEVLAKDEEWLGTESGLADWDISRDAPYFGIEIPDAPGKYFYVWLDAPVGYLASFKAYCKKAGLDFTQELENPATEQIHFIGKDIIYFHTLLWPAMLHFAGKPYRVPDHINVHGFVTVDGRKMSKSRGTGISPLEYIRLGMNAEWLRYYLAAKLTSRVEDVDFTKADFATRVNSELIGKYVNIASRAAGFIFSRFEGKVSDAAMADDLLVKIRAAAPEILEDFENREYAAAVRRVMELADRVPGNRPRIPPKPRPCSAPPPLPWKPSGCSRSTSSPFFPRPLSAWRSSLTAGNSPGPQSIRRSHPRIPSRSLSTSWAALT